MHLTECLQIHPNNRDAAPTNLHAADHLLPCRDPCSYNPQAVVYTRLLRSRHIASCVCCDFPPCYIRWPIQVPLFTWTYSNSGEASASELGERIHPRHMYNPLSPVFRKKANSR